MKKVYLIICNIVIISLVLIIVFLLIKLNTSLTKYKDNLPVYCVGENINGFKKVEYYIYFKDNKLHKMSREFVYENISSENLIAAEQVIYESNKKYKGLTAKMWQNEEDGYLLESIDFNNLDNKDILEIFGILQDMDIKNMTREDLINDVLLAGIENMQCN